VLKVIANSYHTQIRIFSVLCKSSFHCSGEVKVVRVTQDPSNFIS